MKKISLQLTDDQHDILTRVVEKSITRYFCDRRTIDITAERRAEIVRLLRDIKQQLGA